MTEKQTSEHNRAFQEATSIVKQEILLHERPHLPSPSWFLRRKLQRALSLFERALELHSQNWSAMWFIGKIHQRLQDSATALSWFERAYQINPAQPDVVREASTCAMELGRSDVAIDFAHRALALEPENPGLHANLALAYLLAARLPDARAAIKRALTGDTKDTISQTIEALTRHFTANGRTPPTTTQALLAYWAKNRNA